MIVSLLKPIRAWQLVEEGNQKASPGTLVEIPAGTTLELRSTGLNDRTLNVKVGGYCYFIFVEDLESRPSLDAYPVDHLAA